MNETPEMIRLSERPTVATKGFGHLLAIALALTFSSALGHADEALFLAGGPTRMGAKAAAPELQSSARATFG